MEARPMQTQNAARESRSLDQLATCDCDWHQSVHADALAEVVAQNYDNGRLVYERARCRRCGKVAWELGQAPSASNSATDGRP